MDWAPEEHLSEGQGYLPERHKTPQSAENVLQTKHIQQRADAPDVGGKPAGMPYALNVAQKPLCFNLTIFPIVLKGSVSLKKPTTFLSNYEMSLYYTSTLSVSYSSQLLHNPTNRFHVFNQFWNDEISLSCQGLAVTIWQVIIFLWQHVLKCFISLVS